MTSVVLGASALLAMLYDELGGGKVADVLIDSQMCVANFAEVTSHFVHNEMPPQEVDAMLHPLPVTFVEADVELAKMAGHLRAVTSKAGLSLGDRFCLRWLCARDCPHGPPINNEHPSPKRLASISWLSGRRLNPRACATLPASQL